MVLAPPFGPYTTITLGGYPFPVPTNIVIPHLSLFPTILTPSPSARNGRAKPNVLEVAVISRDTQ